MVACETSPYTRGVSTVFSNMSILLVCISDFFSDAAIFMTPASYSTLSPLWPHQKTKESHLVDWKSNRFYYSRTKKYFHTPYWDIMLYLFSVISDDNQLRFENETFMLKICFDHIQSYCSIQYTLMLPDCASDCEWPSLYLVWMLRHFPSPSFFLLQLHVVIPAVLFSVEK